MMREKALLFALLFAFFQGNRGMCQSVPGEFEEDVEAITEEAPPEITPGDHIEEVPLDTLTADEARGLLKMREEEKLARDVYLKLHELWEIPIFRNIASSEEKHMAAVKGLLDAYGLDDPVKSKAVGEFSDPEFTKLHDELIEKGKKSLLDALIVGATIEELDIRDLNELLLKTDKADISRVYENLRRGSINHLRSFVERIGEAGGEYRAQFLKEAELDSLLKAFSGRRKGR